jgi:NitT/TauT family transport system substrate-binding protein
MDVWFSGSEYPFLAWIATRGYKIDGSPGGVKVLKQGFGVDPLLDKQGDCISTKMHNEYWQIIDAGLTPSELVVFNEQGGTMLEDGLYVMESQLRDSVFVKIIASFVKASMRGWEYARQNPDGVTNIVLANVTNGVEREASAAHSERN